MSTMSEKHTCAMIYMITSDCTHCGVCEFMCPQDAIKEAKNQFVVRRRVCNGCGDCVPYCPVRAIVQEQQFAERQEHTRKAELRRILGGEPVLRPAETAADAAPVKACGAVPGDQRGAGK
jgi:MinD superfamily P-loop ATPase